ncbi:3-methyladenine DNA glycosylase AlkD [Lachnospiraceae bacterium KH1T2]|nr:3-methyladenine DNA glycosylase AlkD [Lachnospiraceae bacterium KH1T2]
MNITDRLFELKDDSYKEFHQSLIPNIDPESIIGIRIPVLRKFAKDVNKNEESDLFIRSIPHKFYDENVLHGILISEIKDFDKCIYEVNRFLPFVDNWAVCDIISPKCFKKHKDELLQKIFDWTSDSSKLYTCRFGIRMLMNFFLDDDFKQEYLEIPSHIISDEYYLKMMVAWFFATALAKQWDSTVPYIERKSLDIWTHNKTIQKARESYRITTEQKEYLNSLKIKP